MSACAGPTDSVRAHITGNHATGPAPIDLLSVDVEGARRHGDGEGRDRAGRHPLAVEARARAVDVQRHQLPGIVRRGAGNREHLGALAHGNEKRRQVGLWLDQNAVPAELFQMPSLRAVSWMVCADLDIEAGIVAFEKLADEPLFLLLGRMNRHAYSPWLAPLARA
jgi:hypothetical protein